jgi:hypothetical protein
MGGTILWQTIAHVAFSLLVSLVHCNEAAGDYATVSEVGSPVIVAAVQSLALSR